MSTGWKIKTVTPGVEANTRKMIEEWAVWLEDKQRALDRIKFTLGVDEAECLGAIGGR